MTPPAAETLLPSLPTGARILILRLRSIGDIVLLTPALAMLKEWRRDLHLTVVVEELLLGRNLATAEFLLEVLEHLLVSFGSDWNPGLGESVGGNLLGCRLGLALQLQRVRYKMEKRLNSSPIEVTAQTVYLRCRSLW